MAIGPLLQFAVIVTDCPTAGDAGLAVGAHTGAPAPAVTQVRVWFGGVPDNAKLLQFGFVWVTVAAVAGADRQINTIPASAASGTDAGVEKSKR